MKTLLISFLLGVVYFLLNPLTATLGIIISAIVLAFYMPGTMFWVGTALTFLFGYWLLFFISLFVRYGYMHARKFHSKMEVTFSVASIVFLGLLLLPMLKEAHPSILFYSRFYLGAGVLIHLLIRHQSFDCNSEFPFKE
jgi:hypothetical protein